MYYLNCENRFTLLSSSAPVEDYPDWDADTTYNKGDKVIYKNKIWESVIDENDTEPADDNINWAFISYTNPYRCIDEYINTTTEDDENDLEMWFEINKANGIGLINVTASSVYLELYDANDNLIMTKEESAIAGISNWKDYFFTDLEYKTKFYSDFPFVFQGKIKLVIKRAEKASVGVVLIGYKQDLGITLTGIRSGIDDYSKKEVDENGNIYLKQGKYRDTIDCKVLLKNTDFNTTKQRLIKIRAKPVLYLATSCEDYRELFLYGYYENFSFIINTPVVTDLNLTLRGLI